MTAPSTPTLLAAIAFALEAAKKPAASANRGPSLGIEGV